MQKKKTSILAAILSFCMILGIMPGAMAADLTDLTSKSDITADFPIFSTDSISKVCDGVWNTGASSEPSAEWELPVHFNISFGELKAEITDLKLGSMLGANMGITQFNFEYLENGEWKVALGGVEIPWQYTNEQYEEMNYHLSRAVTANQFRLTVLKTVRRHFRLDEINLYGRMAGLADPLKIKSVKTSYAKTSVQNAPKLPNSVSVMTEENEQKELSVNWEEVVYQNPGTYLVKGTIPYYSAQPVAVVDVFDYGRDLSAYNGNWAYALAEKSVKNGLSSEIALEPGRVLDRADASKLIFRKAVGSFSLSETKFSDVTPCSEFCAVYQTLADLGCFALSDGKYEPEKKVTRIEFLTALVTAEQDTFSEDIALPYQDVTGLGEKETQALKIGLERGIITPGDYFRPNDGITLGEALVILGSVSSGEELNLTFADNDTILRNPNMGLYSYYYDNDTNCYDISYGADLLYKEVPEVSCVYLRFCWAFLEPKKGEYDFSMIDSAIQRYSAEGMQVGLRITSAETGYPYATPSWVYDEGCRGFWWDESGVNANGHYLMPDFNDPIYLDYQEKLVTELGKRYNGNPNIAYVDIGNMGTWGEGHTFTSGVMYSQDTAKRCIDMYADNFPDTHLFVINLTQHYAQLEDYCIERGIGWRNDSFWVSSPQLYTYQSQYDKYWKTNPINMEAQHWERLQGWNEDETIAAFSDIHPSYFGLQWYIGNLMDGYRSFVERAAKRVGYRFLPETVSITNKTRAHGYIELNIMWKNNGCAPAYDDYYPAITLKNKNGSIETVMVDPDFTMKSIDPDSNLIEQARLRLNAAVPGGEYDAYLSVGKLDGTPQIAMPMDGDDGDRRYYLGKITVLPDYEFATEQITGTNKLKITLIPNSGMVGTYDILQTTVGFFEEGAGLGAVYGDITIHSNEATEIFEQGLNKKTTVSFETDAIKLNGEYIEKLKNKKMIVKIRMYNLGMEKGDNTYRGTGLDGVFTELGTAVFDDNGNMTFTPRQ